MDTIIAFFNQHEPWSAIVAYWIYSAAVSAMPAPSNGSAGYQWLYKFCHTIAGNLTTAFGNKIPGGPGPTPANFPSTK